MMDSIYQFILQYYALILMPITYSFIGWMTNVVALKMTFYPLKFVGIPPYLGWQGIIPRKSHKMASVAVDLITERLLKIEDLVVKLKAEDTIDTLTPVLDKTLREVLHDVVDSINSTLWSILPNNFKNQLLNNFKKESHGIITTMLEDFKSNVQDFFPLKEFVLKNLTGDNVKLTVDMFQQVGKKELKFIELSGMYFGFLLGSLQIVFWIYFPIWWTLPLQGIFVGYITNWLALKMIFRPLLPKKIWKFSIQGLFLKRQDEVSEEYSHIVATKILSAKKILNEVIYGKAAGRVLDKIYTGISKSMNSLAASVAKPIITLTMGDNKYEQIRMYIQDKILTSIPESLQQLENYVDKTLDLKNVMTKKMRELTPKEFEVILRSAFQEDEWLLILTGSILGCLVGFAQVFIV